MDPLIFDTSGLLNFGQRGQLQSLLIRFKRVNRLLSTPAVVGELTDPTHKKFNDSFVATHFTIQTAKIVPFDLDTLARLSVVLHPGEVSVIILAKELKGTAVLDEKAARRESDALGVKFTGTLGLLYDALQRGWLTDGECLIIVARLIAGRFRIPKPGANQSFAEYVSGMQ